MNILFIDHFFAQDIEAMRSKAGAHSIRVVHYTHFRARAIRILPEPITEDEKGAWEDPQYARERQQWTAEARRLVYDLYKIFPFDVVIAPSDIFYYLRDVVAIIQELGIPIIILQKETTISPYTMVDHAAEIGRTFPFISDLMLVCSKRHKQFWLNTGADESKIIVTGQPRFDYYLDQERHRSWSNLNIPVPSETKTILFLSYDVGAYSPEGEQTSSPWEEMRSQTEKALLRLANEGYVVLVKPHPQQKHQGEQERLKTLSGPLWDTRFFLLDGELDARHLITNADIVVGFQTTALFEAMIAGKEVIYTFWTDATRTYADLLIPFHEASHLLRCIHSPEALIQAVYQCQEAITDETVQEQRKSFCEEYLGPLDGNATERAWHHIETHTMQHKTTSPLRVSLDEQAPTFCKREIYRSRLQVFFWNLSRKSLLLWYPLWKRLRPYIKKQAITPPREHYDRLLSSWIEHWSQRAQDCRAVLAKNRPLL